MSDASGEELKQAYLAVARMAKRHAELRESGLSEDDATQAVIAEHQKEGEAEASSQRSLGPMWRNLSDYELGQAFSALSKIQQHGLELRCMGLRADADVEALEAALAHLFKKHKSEASRRFSAEPRKEAP